MGILFRNTREVFITPTLPSSFPFVKVMESSLYIVLNGKCQPYISLDNYLNVMKNNNILVKTTEELPLVLGVSLIEVSKDCYIVDGMLAKIHSLGDLSSILNLNLRVLNGLLGKYSIYFNIFEDFSSVDRLYLLKKRK